MSKFSVVKLALHCIWNGIGTREECEERQDEIDCEQEEGVDSEQEEGEKLMKENNSDYTNTRVRAPKKRKPVNEQVGT